MRAGGLDAAEARLRERLARRPSAQDSLWLAEVLAATGRSRMAVVHVEAAQRAWAGADPDFPPLARLHELQLATAAA